MADLLATLADPTNYGNVSGDGPLRPGGRPTKPFGKKDKPSTLSPSAERQRGPLALVRDLWGGTDRLRERAQLYLPQAPGEKAQFYRQRLARTVFFNAFRRAVEGLVGLVFRKDPVLSEDVPAQIQAHWENIDNAGTHGDVFVRELFQDAKVAGHAAILVDFPKTDGRQIASQEMAGEVRPYWVPIKKDDIMSWRLRSEGGRTILAQIVIRECREVAEGEFGVAEQERYRVLYLDETGLPAWKLIEEGDDDSVTVVDEGVYGNQEEIPLAEIVTVGKVSMFESDPPLKDLAHLNVAHYQMWSDYNWSIHKTCVPVLFAAGIPEARDPQTGELVPFSVGANTAVVSSDAAASLQYVAHSGESLGSVKAALDDLKNDMGTLALAMLAPQKRTAETAEAKRLDKATSDSALSVSARGLQDGLERALGFHARYLRLDSGGSVEINRDFEGLLMDAPVMGAFATLVQAGFPPRPVLEALQQGGRIGPDADLDALEMEWMVGSAAAEQARQDAMIQQQGGAPQQDSGDTDASELHVERDEAGRLTRLRLGR
jgi:hypothetical protein